MFLHAQNVASLCLHCGQPVPIERFEYCCQGCEIVSKLLCEADLSRFYDLKPKLLLPQINYFSRRHDFSWIDEIENMKSGYIVTDVEGLQCAACVWVIQEIARRMDAGTRVDVDLILGRISLIFNPEKFSVREFAEKLFKLGYRLKNKTETKNKNEDGLLLRLGVCVAVAMNTMFLAIAFYSGLNRSEPHLFEVINRINFYLTFITVFVGGSYFFKKSYLSLKAGILHFDLMISIGILAAFTGSVMLYLKGRGDESYFDTINIFITLMLAGRFIQERVISKNRNSMLIQDELSELKILKVGKEIKPISLKDVCANDVLLLQAGSLVPVACELLDKKADFSLSWISGESLPVTYKQNDTIPAGAQLAGQCSIKLLALESYEKSPVRDLQPKNKEETFLGVVWQWVVARYVFIVLTAATLGSVSWYFIDSSKALNVLTAILVVTCPCSLGVAIPMARVMADFSLRRHGVFIRGSAVLDKIVQVKNIYFDKTGTLTLAILDWTNQAEALSILSRDEKNILYSMTLQSRHPASLSVHQALSSQNLVALDLRVREIPGSGLICSYEGHDYALGSFFDKSFQSRVGQYSVGFYKNGKEINLLILEEKILDNAFETLSKLHERGLRTYLLSGDKTDRVERIAKKLGFKNFYGDLLPEDKARVIRRISRNLPEGATTLVIGDGLNDAKAFEAATLAGTPIWDYSAMAQGADFYYISGNLTWLESLLKTAILLNKTIRLNLIFSLLFNISAVSYALTGQLSPLMAAVIMPVGSIGILSVTIHKMRGASA